MSNTRTATLNIFKSKLMKHIVELFLEKNRNNRKCCAGRELKVVNITGKVIKDMYNIFARN